MKERNQSKFELVNRLHSLDTHQDARNLCPDTNEEDSVDNREHDWSMFSVEKVFSDQALAPGPYRSSLISAEVLEEVDEEDEDAENESPKKAVDQDKFESDETNTMAASDKVQKSNEDKSSSPDEIQQEVSQLFTREKIKAIESEEGKETKETAKVTSMHISPSLDEFPNDNTVHKLNPRATKKLINDAKSSNLMSNASSVDVSPKSKESQSRQSSKQTNFKLSFNFATDVMPLQHSLIKSRNTWNGVGDEMLPSIIGGLSRPESAKSLLSHRSSRSLRSRDSLNRRSSYKDSFGDQVSTITKQLENELRESLEKEIKQKVIYKKRENVFLNCSQ